MISAMIGRGRIKGVGLFQRDGVKRYLEENGYGGMNEALLNRVNINFEVN